MRVCVKGAFCLVIPYQMIQRHAKDKGGIATLSVLAGHRGLVPFIMCCRYRKSSPTECENELEMTTIKTASKVATLPDEEEVGVVGNEQPKATTPCPMVQSDGLKVTPSLARPSKPGAQRTLTSLFRTRPTTVEPLPLKEDYIEATPTATPAPKLAQKELYIDMPHKEVTPMERFQQRLENHMRTPSLKSASSKSASSDPGHSKAAVAKLKATPGMCVAMRVWCSVSDRGTVQVLPGSNGDSECSGKSHRSAKRGQMSRKLWRRPGSYMRKRKRKS